jgi:hypothetical protein
LSKNLDYLTDLWIQNSRRLPQLVGGVNYTAHPPHHTKNGFKIAYIGEFYAIFGKALIYLSETPLEFFEEKKQAKNLETEPLKGVIL